MFPPKLSITEKLTLLLVFLMLLAGFLLFYVNRDLFLWYVAEDHLVEWMTVLGLLLGFGVCIMRFLKLLRKRGWWFLAVTLLLAVFLFFAAGEEISWGQRLLGIQSSDYFKENNAQGETNLHNLVVDGVKLNKLIFTLVLGVIMGIYLVMIPIVHAKNGALKKFLDRSAVPVPRLYQIIAFGVMALITTLIPDGKNAELLECGAALLFFLMIRFPNNAYLFSASSLDQFREHKRVHS
jgi:hypothetical protein